MKKVIFIGLATLGLASLSAQAAQYDFSWINEGVQQAGRELSVFAIKHPATSVSFVATGCFSTFCLLSLLCEKLCEKIVKPTTNQTNSGSGLRKWLYIGMIALTPLAATIAYNKAVDLKALYN